MSSIVQARQPALVGNVSVCSATAEDSLNKVRDVWPASVEFLSDWSSEAQFAQYFADNGTLTTIARNSELYADGQSVEYVYRVESGAIRTCKLLSDGRRQIEGFYLKGDILGVEMGRRHLSCAEAITRSSVRAVRMRYLRSRIETGGHMASILWDMTAKELQRSREHIQLLSRRSAHERVASFMLSLAGRMNGRKALEMDDLTLNLPMSRQDIADYLGLTIETVSRTFTQLENMGVIKLVSARCVHLCNRTALLELNG